MFERKTIASFFLSLGLAVSPAPAQQSTQSEHHPGGTMPSQAMPGGTSMMGQDGMGGMPMMAAMTGHVEGRLAFLKTELKITDAQLPLWSTFAQAVRDNAKAMQDTMHGGMMGTSQSPSLPDKLAMREKAMTAHLEALRKLKTAVDPLYAALSIGIVASSHERPLPHIIAPVI